MNSTPLSSLGHKNGQLEPDAISLLHFVISCILGYLYPTHLLELTILGMIIEGVKDLICPPHRKILANCTMPQGSFERMYCNQTLNVDIHPRWSNIMFNLFGLVAGQWAQMMVHSKKGKKSGRRRSSRSKSRSVSKRYSSN